MSAIIDASMKLGKNLSFAMRMKKLKSSYKILGF